MIPVPASSAHHLALLFASRASLRAVTDAVVESRVGRAWADDPQQPRVARLDVGCYTILGGDLAALDDRALTDLNGPRELVLPENGSWDDTVRRMLGSRTSDRPMTGYRLDRLDGPSLGRHVDRLPAEFAIAPMKKAHIAQLDGELEPHAVQAYGNVDLFAKLGFGYCALAGDRVVSAATTYTLASRSAEIAIATRPEARGRGLAAAVAASLVRHCLHRGVTPHWNASNPVSKRLAVRLGFREVGRCPILFLE